MEKTMHGGEINWPDAPLGQAIAEALAEHGWWAAENVMPTTLWHALAEDLRALQVQGALQPAGIGRGQNHQHNATIRRDTIHWLSGATPAQAAYLAAMERLRQTLNQTLWLGLFSFEAHFACYAPGAFYRKHLDSFRGAANRLVSVVTYLNPAWPEDAGGELCLYREEHDAPFARIAPQAGTLVVFFSEKIPHEVLAARQARASIAGWFRLRPVCF